VLRLGAVIVLVPSVLLKALLMIDSPQSALAAGMVQRYTIAGQER
jgi:hypothetical protein